MYNNDEIDITELYNTRKKIRDLYDNDVRYGDLVGALLGIREKNKCVDSMEVKLQQTHSINIEFVENTTEKDKEKVIKQMDKCIYSYIEDNIKKVGVSQRELDTLSSNCPNCLCDHILVGESLSYML